MVSTRSSTRDAAPSASPPSKRSATQQSWSFAPTSLTLIWLAISLPLVIWDSGYMLGRPHTFEGGFLYWPLYVPYKLYETIDYVYSMAAYEEKNGFSGAQTAMNVVEVALYLWFIFLYVSRGDAQGKIVGRDGGVAAVVLFSAAVMTLSKTALYWLCEYYSDFSGIGHNDATTLFFYWIIPNGAWIVVPAYLCYSIGGDIIEGLASSTHAKSN